MSKPEGSLEAGAGRDPRRARRPRRPARRAAPWDRESARASVSPPPELCMKRSCEPGSAPAIRPSRSSAQQRRQVGVHHRRLTPRQQADLAGDLVRERTDVIEADLGSAISPQADARVRDARRRGSDRSPATRCRRARAASSSPRARRGRVERLDECAVQPRRVPETSTTRLVQRARASRTRQREQIRPLLGADLEHVAEATRWLTSSVAAPRRSSSALVATVVPMRARHGGNGSPGGEARRRAPGWRGSPRPRRCPKRAAWRCGASRPGATADAVGECPPAIDREFPAGSPPQPRLLRRRESTRVSTSRTSHHLRATRCPESRRFRKHPRRARRRPAPTRQGPRPTPQRRRRHALTARVRARVATNGRRGGPPCTHPQHDEQAAPRSRSWRARPLPASPSASKRAPNSR